MRICISSKLQQIIDKTVNKSQLTAHKHVHNSYKEEGLTAKSIYSIPVGDRRSCLPLQCPPPSSSSRSSFTVGCRVSSRNVTKVSFRRINSTSSEWRTCNSGFLVSELTQARTAFRALFCTSKSKADTYVMTTATYMGMLQILHMHAHSRYTWLCGNL